jgi:WD40 repeat protein
VVVAVITALLVHVPGREVPAGEPTPAPAPPDAAGVPVPNTDLYGDSLPTGAVARLGTARLRPARCLAFSPDGKTLATGEIDVIRFWDTATGRQVHQIAARFHEEFCGPGFLAFSPDGRRLAALRRGHEVGVWNVGTGKRLFSVELHTEGCVALRSNEQLTFTSDGGMLWAGTNDAAFVLDATTGKVIARVNTEGKDSKIATALAFSPDGNTFAAATSRGKDVVELWSRAGGKPLLTLEVPKEDDGVQCLAFSHDGRLLAAGSGDGTTRVWHVTTGKEVYKLKGPEVWIESVAFAPDDRTLAVVGDVNVKSDDSEDRIIRVWDLAAAAKVGRAYRAPGLRRVTFSPDGKTLAGICFDTCARLIDRATGQDLNHLAGHVGAICAVAYTPDGKLVATAGKDHSIRLWDAHTGKQFRVLEGHSDTVHAIAFSPDSRWLVSAGGDATVALWEIATGRRLFHSEGNGGVSTVAFAPDGKSFASGGFFEPIRLWGVPTGKPGSVVEGSHGGQTTALAFSPDGKTLACGGIRTVLLCDAATGKVRRSLTNGQDTSTLMVIGTRSLAFSPDGKTLASDDDQGKVLWETATGRVRSTLPGPGMGGALAFSPDGRLLVSGSALLVLQGIGVPGLEVPVAHVWDLLTGAEIGTIAGHTGPVHAVAFSPDGTRLVTASEGATALIWDVAAVRRSWSRAAGRTPAAPTLSGPKDLEAARAALAGEDAAKAYGAIQSLAASPAQSIPFLRRWLKPVPVPDKERVASLLNDLDSDRFETRERASAALQEFRSSIEAPLRKRLAEKPGAEAARRIRLLLERIEPTKDSEVVYVSRVVEAIELAGTDDARRLLQELAGRAESACLTRGAGQALQRLNARDGHQPMP